MKRVVKVEEVVDGEGFEAFLGRNITLFCGNYIYTGVLVGINNVYLKLEQPKIVYETGAFNTKDWQDAQALPRDLYIMIQSIEAFGEVK